VLPPVVELVEDPLPGLLRPSAVPRLVGGAREAERPPKVLDGNPLGGGDRDKPFQTGSSSSGVGIPRSAPAS
jgi:hypothetical protein